MKRLNLVLQLHEVRDCLEPDDVSGYAITHNVSFLPFIGVINSLQGDILLVLEQAIEFRPQTMESKLCQQKLYICADKRPVSCADYGRGILCGRREVPLPPSWPMVRAHVSSHPVWLCASLMVYQGNTSVSGRDHTAVYDVQLGGPPGGPYAP